MPVALHINILSLMSTQIDSPTVFISYSWKPFTNKQKVIQLAERLTSNYVNVILDDWNLREGQDKYQFMEQMVNNPDVKRVLLICNKDYTEKANRKSGGVGIESLIISDEIYNQAEQTKFIPIVFEFDELSKPYLPTFIKSRIFIDLSSEDIFEENYEQLMRNLFDKPLSTRPPLGTPPPYILDDEPIYLPTGNKILSIKKALVDERKNAIIFIQDYYNTFINYLPTFHINIEELNLTNYDEVILKSINELALLREDFIKFLDVYTAYSVELDLDRLHNFFERLLNFLLNIDGSTSNHQSLNNIKNDNFKYFCLELFLHFTAFLIKRERFKELSHIVYTSYIIDVNGRDAIESSFCHFRNPVSSLNEFRNQKYKMNRISITADTIREKATGLMKFDELKQADVLLYYLSIMNEMPAPFHRRLWFPETGCYQNYESLGVMKKCASGRFFDKLKPLLKVNSLDDLKSKVAVVEEKGLDRIERHQFEIPQIKYGLNIEKLCTVG